MKNIRHAFIAAAALLVATPAAAQVMLLDLTTSVPLAATFDNPCTVEPEVIVFQGSTDLSQRVWLLPDGNLRLQLAERTTLDGYKTATLLGQIAKYTVSAHSEKDLEFDPVGFSILQFKKVVREGANDNFHAVLVMAFDPQNLGLQLGLEAACDNGMP
jgi:hypothetical protein